MKKILLLGNTGKIGIAIVDIFNNDYIIVGKNSKDHDAKEFDITKKFIKEEKPDIVINAVALLGIDLCEDNPIDAYILNTLYPRFLAKLSNEYGFILVHFGTDAEFSDSEECITESTIPEPLNVYGVTKYGGIRFVMNISKRYYVIRIASVFGKTNKCTQFVEKMLKKKHMRVADDVIYSHSYSKDIARRIKTMIENEYEYGLYHLCNESDGVSLYGLMKEILIQLDSNATIEKASYKEFPHKSERNRHTIMMSEKIPSLRYWKDAVKEYCSDIKK